MKNCTLRKIAALLTILTVGLTLMLTGCTWNFGDFINPGDQLGGGGTVDEVPDTPDVSGVIDSVGSLDVSDSSVDTADTWDDSATFVEFTGSGATVQGAGAVFESGVLTVSAAGVYVLSGTLTDGAEYTVFLNADDEVLKSDSEDEGLGNIYWRTPGSRSKRGTTAFRPTAICM